MYGWLGRTWARLRADGFGRTVRASGYEAVAGTVGRTASGIYGRLADPEPVWEREWDVLCLLDGCRYDLMCEAAADGRHEFLPDPDDVDVLWSVGSQSAEWMAETFGSDHRAEMARTAYLTGNPFTAQSGDQLAAIDTHPLPLAAEDFGLLYEPWRDEWTDADISTIPPGPLTDAAIATWRRRDDLGVERVVVHYMQPHAPFRSRSDWFLGDADTGGWGRIEDDDESDGTEDVDLAALDPETREFLEALDAGTEEMRDPWTRVRDGELPADEFWRAYRDNLAWVLEDVARLVENCDGTVALSSDHGNAAGEYGVWSHPPAVHLPALRRVPWVEVDGVDRGTERPGLPASIRTDRGPEADVEDRLADLGYR